jgi:hypothetical protein
MSDQAQTDLLEAILAELKDISKSNAQMLVQLQNLVVQVSRQRR